MRAVRGKLFEGGAFNGEEPMLLVHTAKELYMRGTDYNQEVIGQGEPQLVHALARETDMKLL